MIPRNDPRAADADAEHGRGWLPHPALSVLLALVWLLLQQSLAVPQLITAAVLALVVPKLVHGFLGPATRPRTLAAALRLSFVVLWDIVISNVTVARIVLSPRSNPRPAWVVVPMDSRHPTAITLLATIITMTPGTVSCVVDDEAEQILVHALDCDDAAAMAAQIKARYERPLMEIFG
jgi:multicomponent K+:H+ antiporter subunit E